MNVYLRGTINQQREKTEPTFFFVVDVLWKCYFGSVQVVHFERMEMEVVKKPKKWLNYRLKFFQCLPGRKRICIHFWIGFVVKFYEPANSLWQTLSFGTKCKKMHSREFHFWFCQPNSVNLPTTDWKTHETKQLFGSIRARINFIAANLQTTNFREFNKFNRERIL